MNDTVWVTGGAGYVGGNVCAELLRKKLTPIVIDHFEYNFREFVKDPRIFIVEQEIEDLLGLQTKLAALTKKIGRPPRAVIHLAAETSVTAGEYYKEKFCEVNVVGTFNVAKVALELGCKNFVYASSAAVYGNLDGWFNKKSHKDQKNLRPTNFYGWSKLKAEEVLCNAFPELRLTILRYFNIAGAGKLDDGHWIGRPDKASGALIHSLVESYLTGVMPTLARQEGWLLNKFPVRDFIHVEDVAYATVWRAINTKNHWGTVVENIGRGIGVDIREVSKQLSDITRVPTDYYAKPMRESDTLYSVAKVATPWTGRKFRTLEQMIKSELAWQQSPLYRNIR